MITIVCTHYEGTEITAVHQYEAPPPRVISKEVRAYYPDYCVAEITHMRLPDTGAPSATIVLVDRRDADKPKWQWEHQAIDLYVDML